MYRLNIHTLRMDRLHAQGEAPGWIYRHRAVTVPPHGIRIWGARRDNAESHEQNFGSFVLDLEELRWRRRDRLKPIRLPHPCVDLE